jgi:ABC-type arginine transport system permease subunit
MMDEIAIYCTSGKLVKTLSNVKPNQSIDISGLAAGIYHISVKTTAAVSGIQLVVQ